MNSLGRQLSCQCGLSGGIPAFELFIGWHSSMGCYCDFPPDLAEFDSNPGWNYRE
jgi:hypothetical protein